MSIDERVTSALEELEVTPEQLRSDPRGETWLPWRVRALVDEAPGGDAQLREFVEFELALYEDGPGACDALFTAGVMKALPENDSPHSFRRTVILAAAHALAIGVAYLVLWPAYQAGEIAPLVGDAQTWLDTAMSSFGIVGPLGLMAALTMLLLLPRPSSGQLGRQA